MRHYQVKLLSINSCFAVLIHLINFFFPCGLAALVLLPLDFLCTLVIFWPQVWLHVRNLVRKILCTIDIKSPWRRFAHRTPFYVARTELTEVQLVLSF